MVDPNSGGEERPDEPIHIDAEDARAGEIVLRKRWQRRVFIAGLAGIVVLFVILRFVAWG
jgi:hypothetical protein